MKVLYVVPVGGSGGAEKIVYDLALDNVRKGNYVKIVYLKGPLTQIFINNDKIEKFVLNLYSIKDLPQTLVSLYKIIKSFQPDLVHSHIFYSHVVSRLLKPIFNYRLICSEHGSITPYTKIPKIFFKINNFLKKQSDLNTNVCEESAQSYINYGFYKKNEIVSVYNGIDIHKFINIESKETIPEDIEYYFNSNNRVFLSIGRLSPEKNFPLLIHAFSKYCTKSNVQNHLLIVGEGKEEEKLKGLVNSLQMSEQIHFLGRRNDVNLLLKLCDYYCLSSDHEGLPTVLLEAVFSKKPIISTDCCGAKEILLDNLFISPVGNIEEYTLKLLKATDFNHSLIIEQRYQNALIKFTQQAMLEEWSKIYQVLMNNSKFKVVE